MKVTIFISLLASLSGMTHAHPELNEFEGKVSILIQKLMDSKYLMSNNESSLLKERLAKFDKFINASSINVPVKSSLSSKTEDHINRSTTSKPSLTTTPVITPVNNEVLLTKVKQEVASNGPEVAQPSTKHPLWSPLSAAGKPSTRPPYLISFTPYTTPTPLPNRPDWKNEDWLDYFKENHPNFWFQKQLRKKLAEKLNSTMPIPAAVPEEGMPPPSSEFDYENWKSWTPEQWIKWSNSKEYKEKYLNVLNPYKAHEGHFPFKTYEDLDGPVLDYRDSQPVYLSESQVDKLINEQKIKDADEIIEYQDYNDPPEEEVTEVDKTTTSNPLPPETYFPKPTTISPDHLDPFYIHTKNYKHRNKQTNIAVISDEYIYQKDEKSARQDLQISPDDFRYR